MHEKDETQFIVYQTGKNFMVMMIDHDVKIKVVRRLQSNKIKIIIKNLHQLKFSWTSADSVLIADNICVVIMSFIL